MSDKHFKPSIVSAGPRDAGTECSEDFMQELEQIPSHPSFIQPLLEQGETAEDGRKLLRKIKQDPEWKKRVEKMLNFELHTLRGRLSWEQDKLNEQKKCLRREKEEGDSSHSGQLQLISQLKQNLREYMTNRIKLESNLAEDKRLSKKLVEEAKKAAKPRPKLSEVLNRAAPAPQQQPEETASRLVTPVETASRLITPVESASASRLITPVETASASRLVTPVESAVSAVCTEYSELSRPASPLSSLPSPSPSHTDRPASRSSRKESGSPRGRSPSPSVSDNPSSAKMPCYLSEAGSVGKPASLAQSQDSVKFPKITNSPLISAPDTTTKPPSVQPDPSIQFGLSQEESAVSLKSKCSRCGTKKSARTHPSPRGISTATQDSQPTLYAQAPASYLQYPPPHLRQATLPSHNLHLSSPPVLLQHAPIPYSYLQPCHECVPAPQHLCHQQLLCSPCPLHKEAGFSQQFENLKEFIREEIRTGWTKSPRARRPKGYPTQYTGTETTTASETESEDPYLLPGQTRSSLSSKRAGKPLKTWKGQDTSVHTLAATHSLQSKRSEDSSILDDELFMKLVSNPAKYSYELQEIAKLLTSPPASRASSTTSRQKLRTIKHLVRDAISSYSTSEMDSDTADEGPLRAELSESDANLSRLEHVSSRTIHKARKAKEQGLRVEPRISPKPSILKTSSRTSDRAVDPATSLTGLKRVNFSSETINIDDGQPMQVSNIPDDYVVVEEDEISLATQELQQSEQSDSALASRAESADALSSPTKSTMHVAYPYDQYIAGELAEPYTILQNENESVSLSESAASGRGGRVGAASRVLTEMGLDSELSNKLSYSHSLELKASLPSIPSYVSGTESRNSISLRPNKPALESADQTDPGRGGLLSHRASLNQVVPQDLRRDELEEEKRSNRDIPTPPDAPAVPVCVEVSQVETDSQPPSRRGSLSLGERESRRQSLAQLSRVSLVSKPSRHTGMQQQPSLAEESVIEKQTSKSSLAEKASRIFSSITSLVSMKASKSSQQVGPVAEEGSNTGIHSNVSNASLPAHPQSEEANTSVSWSGSKQEIPKANSSVSKVASKQDDLQKVNSSVSKVASKQEELQKVNSSVSKVASKQEIPKANSSVSKVASKQEELQKVNSSVSKVASKQEELQKVNSSVSKVASKQEELQKVNSSVSKVASKQEELQKVNSSVSKVASKQEIPKANSSVSKVASKQEELQKVNSSVSKVASKQEELQKVNSSVSKVASKQEELQKVNSTVSKVASKQEELQKVNSSVSKVASKQEELQKINSSVSKVASKQEELQKINSSVSKVASKQEELQKNSSVSKVASKQEELQKINSSVSKVASKQEELQKVNSSVSKVASKQEELQKVNSSVSKVASKQEELQKINSSVSKVASKQEELQKVNSSVSKVASKQEELQKVNSSVSKVASKQEELQINADSNQTDEEPPQCDCTDCPDPTECPGPCAPPEPTQDTEQTPAGPCAPPVEPSVSAEAPVRIVLSPEAPPAARAEEGGEMGVVMTFSKEWKIVCTKACPGGVQETTITDWRDPNVDSEVIQVSQSSEPMGEGTDTVTSLEGEVDSSEGKEQSSQIDTPQVSESIETPAVLEDTQKTDLESAETEEPVSDRTEFVERAESAQQEANSSNSAVTAPADELTETGECLEEEHKASDKVGAPTEDSNAIEESGIIVIESESTVEAPIETIDITGPTESTETIDITGPTESTETIDSTGTTESNATETIDSTGPTESTETIDSTGTTESNATETIDSTGTTESNATETIDSTGPTESTETIDSTGTTESNATETIDSTGTTESNATETIDSTGPTESTETIDSTGTTESNATETIDSTGTTESNATETIDSTGPTESTENIDNTGPTESNETETAEQTQSPKSEVSTANTEAGAIPTNLSSEVPKYTPIETAADQPESVDLTDSAEKTDSTNGRDPQTGDLESKDVPIAGTDTPQDN